VKDFESRFKIAQNVLSKLASEFEVEIPKLMVKNMKKLHGFYALDTITLNTNTLHNNLAEALRTVRHEFYHYLQDVLDLPEKKSELKAKRFEKDVFSLEILPKSQTKLFERESEP